MSNANTISGAATAGSRPTLTRTATITIRDAGARIRTKTSLVSSPILNNTKLFSKNSLNNNYNRNSNENCATLLVKKQHRGGASALMYAAQQGDVTRVKKIIRAEPASLLIRDRTGKSPLHYCCTSSEGACAAQAADILVMAAPDLVEGRDDDGFTPLHLAVIAGNMPLVNFLLANNADVKALDNEKHTVVHWATVCGETSALRAVLTAGAPVSTPDIHGGYPLHYAAQMCGGEKESQLGLQVLQTLIAHANIQVSCEDDDGRQPLLWAASAGSAQAILALVRAGASVEASDKDGLTALHCAASRGHTDCIDTLLTLCGASPDVIDSNGCTALHYAVTLGHADATALLLAHGADPNCQDRKGRTPAHCGCAKGQLETVKMIAAHGANLWLKNTRGDLPLHEASASGRRELVKWLLEMRPSQVNARNNDGRCPLHLAALNDNADMCKILLDSGAQINPVLRTSHNFFMTPLDCALQKGFRSTAKFLQLHGGIPASRLGDFAKNKRKPQPGEALSGGEGVKAVHLQENLTLIGRSKSDRKSGGKLVKNDSSSTTTSNNNSDSVSSSESDLKNDGRHSKKAKSRRVAHRKRLFQRYDSKKKKKSADQERSEDSRNDQKNDQKTDQFDNVSTKQRLTDAGTNNDSKLSHSKLRNHNDDRNGSERTKLTGDRVKNDSKASNFDRLRSERHRSTDDLSKNDIKTSSNFEFRNTDRASEKQGRFDYTNEIHINGRTEINIHQTKQILLGSNLDNIVDQNLNKMASQVDLSCQKVRILTAAAADQERAAERRPRSAKYGNKARRSAKNKTTSSAKITDEKENEGRNLGRQTSSERIDVFQHQNEEIRNKIQLEEKLDANKNKERSSEGENFQKVDDNTKVQTAQLSSEKRISEDNQKIGGREFDEQGDRASQMSNTTSEEVEDGSKSLIVEAAVHEPPKTKEKRNSEAETKEEMSNTLQEEKSEGLNLETDVGTQLTSEQMKDEQRGSADNLATMVEEHKTTDVAPTNDNQETKTTEIEQNLPQIEQTEVHNNSLKEQTDNNKDLEGLGDSKESKMADDSKTQIDQERDGEDIEPHNNEEMIHRGDEDENLDDNVETKQSGDQDQTTPELGAKDQEPGHVEAPESPDEAGENLEISGLEDTKKIAGEPSETEKLDQETRKSPELTDLDRDQKSQTGIEDQKDGENETISGENLDPASKEALQKPKTKRKSERRKWSSKKPRPHHHDQAYEILDKTFSDNNNDSEPVLTRKSEITAEKSEEKSEVSSDENSSASSSGTVKEHKSFRVLDEDGEAEKSLEKGQRRRSRKSRNGLLRKQRSKSEDPSRSGTAREERKSSQQSNNKNTVGRSKIPTALPRNHDVTKKFLMSDRKTKSSMESRVPSLPNINQHGVEAGSHSKNKMAAGAGTKESLLQTRSESNLSAPILTSHLYTGHHPSDSEKEGTQSEIDGEENGREKNEDLVKRRKKSANLKKRRTKRKSSKLLSTARRESQSAESDYDYDSSNVIDSGFEPSPRSSRIPRWRNVSERGVNMTSVTQTIQNNIRRYHLERKIFQHLLDLKRLQIRAGQHNEALLVKRAIDAYHQSCASTVGAGRYIPEDYTFKSFEKFLYFSLRKLQKNGGNGPDYLRGLPEKTAQNPLLCTQSTHRCMHATHAYTGIPCAAYLPQMNHHTIPKIGFTNNTTTQCKPGTGPGGGFLPNIVPGQNPGKKSVTLELSHGSDKQIISLPADRLDQNKRYYVTFTVKGVENGGGSASSIGIRAVKENEGNSEKESGEIVGHTHSKSD